MLDSRRFSTTDQSWFAGLSGDVNPMHMDPVAARRTVAGAAVVHGIHGLVWSLDRLMAARPSLRPLHLDVTFLRFVLVDDVVTLNVLRESADAVVMELVTHGTRASLMTVGLVPPSAPARPATVDPDRVLDAGASDQPHRLGMADLAGLGGRVPSATAPDVVGTCFRHLADRVPDGAVAGLLGLSRLVGMVCPGADSVFASLTVSFQPEAEPLDAIRYYVVAVDDRFRTAEIAVAGLGLTGRVKTYLRQPPVQQPGIDALREHVQPGEFAGQVCLVVGGSRGLGELTAKLLVAGGASVILTYAVGADDARRMQREIVAAGGTCEIMAYDAMQPPEDQLAALPTGVTQAYYFATSKIFLQSAQLFDQAVFDRFVAVYVTGFHRLCSFLSSVCDGKVGVFYPSSVAVETRPRNMLEYAMAKSAGEVLCADITRFLPKVSIVMRRLPRLLTDQTATTMPVKSDPPVPVVLSILRALRDA